MAINFINTVNFNQNELLKPRIENQLNDTAAGVGVEGQLYYDTTLDVLKLFSNGAWTALASASASGVSSITASSTTFITTTQNATSGAVTFNSALNATGTPSATTYLRGDNTWATVTSGPWNITGGAGSTTQAVGPGDTLTVTGGTYIGAVTTATDILTISHNLTTRTDGTSTATPAAGGTFTAIDVISTNSTGHLQGVTLKTVTLPLQTITLTGNVTGSGTGSIVTTIASNVVTFGMMNTASYITSTTGINAGNANNTTFPTTLAIKNYVDTSIVGALIYQGGYDASTNVPNLDATPVITINKGFMWTVTADGQFFTEQVRTGDSLIANINTPTTLADWTRVQSNVDLATATTVGIGNVNAGNGIAVSYTAGTATLSTSDFGLRDKKITLTVATGITKATVSNVTTYTINLAAAWGTGIEASNVMCEVIDATTFLTVYAEIGRTSVSSTNLTIAMTGTITDGLYYVLLHNVE